MSKYTVEWCEVTKTGETNGRAWKITQMTLKDEMGNLTDKISTFDPVMPGVTIEGTIELKGQYKNFKSTPTAPKTGGTYIAKAKAMSDAMERKDASIARFQGSKEESIALAGAQRDAMLVVTTFYQEDFKTNRTGLKEKIVEWRNWFLSDAFTDHPPF